MNKKVCENCGVEKSVSEYHKDKTCRFGVGPTCKECRKEYRRDHYIQNREKTMKQTLEYERNNREQRYGYTLKRNYGMTLVDYQTMLSNQDSRCLGCSRHESDLKRRLFVDHDHKTGKVRGLLCDACNKALGDVGDNTEILGNLIKYLDRSRV